MPREISEYSTRLSAIGAVAAARRIVPAPTSLRPKCRTYPFSTSSAIAPTVSSIGTSGSSRESRWT